MNKALELLNKYYPKSRIIEDGDNFIVCPNPRTTVRTQIVKDELIFTCTCADETKSIKLNECTKSNVKDAIMYLLTYKETSKIKYEINEKEVSLYADEIINGIKAAK